MSIDSSWFFRRRRRRWLSAFADGELPDERADRVAEDLVFDDDARRQLHELRHVDALVVEALSPASPNPDSAAAAEAVLRHLPGSTALRAPTRDWTPTVVASVGLLVTAGVAFAGYRWRSSS